jgi:ABC-type nitrate/sulfonate/bicarbonate transport system ATPase subunit
LRSTGWILKFDKGEIVAIVGTTGCAKSTFLDLLIGLESATSGEIEIGGKNPFDDFKAFRGKIGNDLPAGPFAALANSLDNVKLPLELLGIANAEQVRSELLAGSARLAAISPCLSARVVRRHAPESRHRPCLRPSAATLVG